MRLAMRQEQCLPLPQRDRGHVRRRLRRGRELISNGDLLLFVRYNRADSRADPLLIK